MHWKVKRFYKHWQEVYGKAKSLEEVIEIAGVSSNHLRRGTLAGVENPYKRKNWARNTSGFIGVSFEKKRNRWKATLNVKKKQWIVTCKTFEEACEARKEMERLHLNGEGA